MNQANHLPPSAVRIVVRQQTFGDRDRGDGHQAQLEAVEHEPEKAAASTAQRPRRESSKEHAGVGDIRSLSCHLQIILIGGG